MNEDQQIKPDIGDEVGKPLSPQEALRRARATYGDDSASPNRDDVADEHGGSAEP